MTLSPDPSPPPPPGENPAAPVGPPPLPRGAREWGTRLAWAGVALAVAVMFGIGLLEARGKSAKARRKSDDPEKERSIELRQAARGALGQREMLKWLGSGADDSHDPPMKAVRDAAHTPLERLRAVPVLAELEGKDAALYELDEVEADAAPDKGPAARPPPRPPRPPRPFRWRGTWPSSGRSTPTPRPKSSRPTANSSSAATAGSPNSP